MIHVVTARHHSLPRLRIVDDDVSPARLHGEACFYCGSTEPPLSPDGTVGTRIGDGVLKEWPVVACTLCLRVPR